MEKMRWERPVLDAVVTDVEPEPKEMAAQDQAVNPAGKLVRRVGQKKHAALPSVGHKRAKVKRAGKITQKQKQLKKLYQDYEIVNVKVDPKQMT